MFLCSFFIRYCFYLEKMCLSPFQPSSTLITTNWLKLC